MKNNLTKGEIVDFSKNKVESSVSNVTNSSNKNIAEVHKANIYNYEEVDVNKLNIVKGNSRRHSTKQLEQIVSSIQKNGFVFPLTITRDNDVICGEARLKAAQMLNMTKVPAIILSNVSKGQLRALRILDDKIAEKSEWNNIDLKSELDIIFNVGYDYCDVGITAIDFDLCLSDICETTKNFLMQIPYILFSILFFLHFQLLHHSFFEYSFLWLLRVQHLLP